MKTIGLYGISGVYNYGCEAIIRGTVKILKSLDPTCKIVYYSRRAIEDKNQLSDLDVELYQISKNSSIFNRVINKFLKILNINYRIPSDNYRKMCDECDVLISIGGDIYTIPEYIQAQSIYPYYNRIVQFGDTVIRNGKKLIVYGASIGPFENYERAQKYYFNHLKKVDLIVARERNTLEYLKRNKIKENVCLLPDPAFFVIDEKSNFNGIIANKGYIGINLSPLSLREMYGDVTVEQKKKLASLISKISRKTNLDIMLLPHVLSPINPLDNDLMFLAEIAEIIDYDVKDNIKIVDDAGGFVQTKKYLRECKMVVAARMHCAINAICESVPTILLSYSAKAKGMADFVYGTEEWVLAMDKIDEELMDKIEHMLDNSENIHNYLDNRINEIRNIEHFRDEVDMLSKIII